MITITEDIKTDDETMPIEIECHGDSVIIAQGTLPERKYMRFTHDEFQKITEAYKRYLSASEFYKAQQND